MAAKVRAAELRLPMRRFIEEALAIAINSQLGEPSVNAGAGSPESRPTIWDDQYIGAQSRQPLGAPFDLSDDEARRVALDAFRARPGTHESATLSAQKHLDRRMHGRVGDPVSLSDEDAAVIAREALLF